LTIQSTELWAILALAAAVLIFQWVAFNRMLLLAMNPPWRMLADSPSAVEMPLEFFWRYW